MVKKISTIGYEVPGRSEDFDSFHSKRSLMDSDILVFCTENPNGYTNQYQGKPSYNDTGSFQYKDDTAHWKKEITSFLNSGRTVFLFLKEKESFFLQTGTKEVKSEVIIKHVNEHHNYDFLPVNIGTMTTSKGKGIEVYGNSLFSQFYMKFKNNLEYQVYLENTVDASVIFTGKDKSKVLGAIYKVGTGNLVVLPYLNYSKTKFIRFKKDKNGNDNGYWTNEAIYFGHSLYSSLIEIDRILCEEDIKTPSPNWLSNSAFITEAEFDVLKSLAHNFDKIKKIENDNKNLNIKYTEEQILKGLLFEKGKPLENAVIKALETLGYKSENYNSGVKFNRVIVSPEGNRYIGECEGKDDSEIGITRFKRIIESMNADFNRDEVQEKAFGILFGNPQRLTNPKDRTLTFTTKCKTGAVREKIALVNTPDLFVVAKYLQEKPSESYKKKCREAIHNSLGDIVVFPELPKAVNVVSTPQKQIR